MRRKIIGIVVFMLVATTVVSATNINMKENNNKIVNSEPSEPDLFDWWNVDQKQTHHDGYGITLIPPETNAQSFIPTKDKLTAVALYLFRAGTPSEPVHITLSIRDNLTGSDLATKTIDTSVVTIAKAKWVLFDFEDIMITPSKTYYIVCSGDVGNADNAYCWLFSGNETYASGEAWHKGTAGSAWITYSSGGVWDYCFKTYFRKPLDSTIPSTNGQIYPAASIVDVPVWEKGDSWTYELHQIRHRYYSNGTLSFKLFINYTETITVTDVTGDNYTLKITGKKFEGSLVNGSYRLKFTRFMRETGDLVIRKTDLACSVESYTQKGLVLWLRGNNGFPIPAQLKSYSEARTTPPYRFLPFPFIPGTNGSIPGATQTYQEKWSMYWEFITLWDRPEQTYTFGSTPYHCEMANITIPAGNYNSYNVSIDYPYGWGWHHEWRYYVPELGNQAYLHYDADWDATGKPGNILEYKLVSTTYEP